MSVVLLSGGMDSAVALALAKDEWADRRGEPNEVHAISFRYGQRHSIEVLQAAKIAAYNHVSHKIVSLPADVFEGTGSVLVDEGTSMVHESYEALQASVGPSPTYVPFRNANLISMAVAYAMTIDANEVWVGAHAEDAHNFAYPDCTPEFMGAFAAAIYVGTYHEVRLRVPFQAYTKAEIVSEGLKRQVPFFLTTSCYEPVQQNNWVLACGKCPTCVGRLEAFRANHMQDPIGYVGQQ